VACGWAASCCGAIVGAEDPCCGAIVGAGVSGGGAALAASSVAAVADGVGLRPEQGGDGLIGNERGGAGLHLGAPTAIKVARSPRSWPVCATGGHHGDHRSDGSSSGRSDAGYGWHTA
jgi:hypothetical protein